MEPANKAEAAMDMASDEASAENGGSRRPGNLWTVEAREDMFRRREAGETWETICQDYPKRSRHAMQQQYSMMKKQRALANGTWTSNRRGRKRKNFSPERWAPGNRNGNLEGQDDELTEGDDLSDGSPDGLTETETRVTLPRLSSLADDPAFNGGRPGALSRSITDPASRSARPKLSCNSSKYNIGPVPNPASRPSPASIQATFGEASPVGSTQGKRRKVSPDRPPIAKIPFPTPSPADAPSPHFTPPSVVFDHAEFLSFFQKGIDQAHQAAQGFEMEKMSLKQNFEASVARANRRVHEAQERLRWAQYESGEKIKARARGLVEEREAMRKEFEREKKQVEEIQVSNIEALTRQNERLQRDLEFQRKQVEVQAREYEQEIMKLRSETQRPRRTTRIQDIVNRLSPPPENKPSKQESKREPLLSEDTPGEPAGQWRTIRRSEEGPSRKLVEDVKILKASIKQLNKEVNTLSMKEIISDINRLDEESTIVLKSTETAAQAFKVSVPEADNLPVKSAAEVPSHTEKVDLTPSTNGA